MGRRELGFEEKNVFYVNKIEDIFKEKVLKCYKVI